MKNEKVQNALARNQKRVVEDPNNRTPYVPA